MRASGLLDRGLRFQGTYAAAFENGQMVGVVAHYWNHNLIFQTSAHHDALARAAISASGRQLKGLIGPANQVEQAWQALCLEGSALQMDEQEQLYSLRLQDLIEPPALSSGQVHGRRIEPEDVDLVTEWRVAYAIETLGDEYSSELEQQCRRSVENALETGHTWILEREGERVACSSFNAAILEAVQVGGVWTPPALRRRGYGRCAVAASLLDARTNSVEQAILFTGERNIPAQKAYRALGFRRIGDYRIVLLREPAVVPIKTIGDDLERLNDA
jgi:predicted GNAT family acetyltransferase